MSVIGSALCIIAGEKYKNHFSELTILANKSLGLPEENLELLAVGSNSIDL